MKTILKTYHKNSDVIAYHKYEKKGVLHEYTSDKEGNPLSFKNSKGYSYEFTHDKYGNVLAYKNSDGYSYEFTRDEYGNVLAYKSSKGYSYEYTRDKNGYPLAYKNSKGFYSIKDKEITKEQYEDFINQLNSTNLDGND